MGRSHLALGIMSGILAAKGMDAPLPEGVALTALAAVSALVPDLDVDGLLMRRLTERPLKLVRRLLGYAGVMLILLSYFPDTRNEQFGTAMIGLLCLGVGFVLQDQSARRWMVSLMGVLLAAFSLYWRLDEHVFTLGGLFAGIQESGRWMIWLGLFIAVIPHFPHRTYSHTLWALAIWGAIWYEAEASLQLAGLFAAGTAGYASHLLADTLTVSGVRYFHPFPPAIRLPLIRTKKDRAREHLIVIVIGIATAVTWLSGFNLPLEIVTKSHYS